MTGDPDGASYIITVMTEYFSTDRTGFMQIKLDSGYEEARDRDEEKIFDGYTMRITSAYYPDSTVAYAMAVDQADSSNYLIQYEWADPNSAPDLYLLKGFSEDPTAGTYTGNAHRASVIYAVNTDAYDMPAKGYIAGSARSIWAWNDCLAPDFGITVESYQ